MIWEGRAMGRFSAAGRAAKARKKAEEEYDAGWNLRPVEGAPAGLIDSIRQICAETGAVGAATLAEARGDDDREIRYRIGIRMRLGARLRFSDVESRLASVLSGQVTKGRRVEYTELDADVSAVMSDGSANPYVVYGGRAL
jgi:hypothetical protein